MKFKGSLYHRVSIGVVAFGISLLFVTCEKDKDEPTGNNKAELSDITSDTVSYTSAIFKANVNSTGNHNIVDHGFCYSLENMPDKNDSVKSLGNLAGKGIFIASLENLQPNTKYNIRGFITIPSGTIYSQETSFTTLKTGRPSALSDSVFTITPYSAQISGTIVSDSGLVVITRGFCWGKEPQPDFLDSTLYSVSDKHHFIESISNLTNATTYFLRSFATNAAGTSFGNEISFVTDAIIPTVTIQEITNINTTYSTGGGEVINDGGAAITGRGVCWSTTENPTIFNNHTLDGEGLGSFNSDLNGLTPSTTYYVRAYATNHAGTAYSIQLSFVTESLPTLAVVTTSGITNITTNYGLGGGIVLSDGGSSVLTRGVCWATTQNPTILGLHTTNGSGTGLFTSDLTGLAVGTTYYVRAYATNSIGTAYGNQESFTTANVHTTPTVTTLAITSVTSNSALSGGNVTNTGGDAVTSRGVCWGISPTPTIAGSHTTDGSGSGSFISNLSGLNASTTYYVRAYATNISGTAYGEQLSFVTSVPPVLPTLVTASVSSVTTNSAICGGNISDDGGATVTARGVCWSTSQNPTITSSHTADGTGTGSYSSSMTSLNAGITYYVRAYATNSAGTAYGGQQSFITLANPITPTVTTTSATNITQTTATSGGNVISDGGANVTARGVCWSISSNPTIANSHTTNGSGTGAFSSNLTGLTANTLYHIRAYATNSAGTSYGSDLTFTTMANSVIPTVTTTAATNITQTTATSGGNVTSDGGANVTARGVCWSTSQNPSIFGSHTTDGSGTGTFISSLSGLSPVTTYYIRAYATNSAGTAYGSQESFTTTVNIMVPTVTTAAITGIGPNTATGGGNVTASGGATVTARGVCWSTSQNPTLGDAFTSDGSGTGLFISNITGLNPSTTYYVKAYATNSQGTSYGNQESFTTTSSGIQCNDFTLTHTAGSVAPVSKSVNYSVALTDLSGETKCWITQNLGANFQATTVNDNSEAAAGWYWQFNHHQGYKHDGANRTPNSAWISPISENTNWNAFNDPCNLLLGANWRIPTVSEWQAVISNGGWANYNNAYNSDLKLHAAGYLYWNTGNLSERSNYGLYWSNGQNNNQSAYNLFIAYGQSMINYNDKSAALSIRCLSDGNAGTSLPSVITSSINSITSNSAQGGGDATFSGGVSIIAKGVCWSTNQNPTLNDNFTTNGSGTGPFQSNITGLIPSTTYYVRAYATNSLGTAYGNQVSFTTTSAGFICGNTLTINHIAGEVAPVNKTVNYGTVETNLTGSNKCWITQNLGADRQALSATDDTEASAGWYWQFNRKQGYKHDGITRTPNTTWISSIYENSDWLLSNDPCNLLIGNGWRIPTRTEWQNADENGGWDNYNETFASILKLHAAGYLSSSTGILNVRGTGGLYHSSNQFDNNYGYYLILTSSACAINSNGYIKAHGFPLRCIFE